jgi:hypothetical protein
MARGQVIYRHPFRLRLCHCATWSHTSVGAWSPGEVNNAAGYDVPHAGQSTSPLRTITSLTGHGCGAGVSMGTHRRASSRARSKGLITGLLQGRPEGAQDALGLIGLRQRPMAISAYGGAVVPGVMTPRYVTMVAPLNSVATRATSPFGHTSAVMRTP